MKVNVFEFVPAKKAINETNNRKSRKSKRKAAKHDTSLRARENDRQSSIPTEIETVTIIKKDYQKLTGSINHYREIIKQSAVKYNKLKEEYDNAIIDVINWKDCFEYQEEVIKGQKETIHNQYNEIKRLKAIIKDIKGTVITMCDTIK